MKNVILVRISVILVISAGLLLFLFSIAKMPNEEKNGFIRKLDIPLLEQKKEIGLDKGLTRINGIATSSIYLSGNDPRATFIISRDFKRKDSLLLNIAVPEEKITPSTLLIDSPYLYMHLFNAKTVVSGSFSNPKLNQTILKSEIFVKSLQISHESIIIRAFSPILHNLVFQKVNIHSGEKNVESEIVEKSNDFGLSSDGMFAYDYATNNIIYVEYFTNKFYCIDTNLNVKYKGNTIDTTFSANIIMTNENMKNGETKISALNARRAVNRNAFLNSKYIFIASKLKADNETNSGFRDNDVVDVYNIFNGKYVSSFYIPKWNNKSYSSAKISDNDLFVLYPGKLIVYRLPQLFR